MKRLPLLLVLMVTACAPLSPAPAPTSQVGAGAAGYPWWNDSTFYEIFVRSFHDSNGDGIGDLNGVVQKLDYLNDGNPDTDTDLGVTGIWLMPIFPSPSYHGYDVTDFYSVNPQYGTLDDFKRLLTEAHRRGIRVIIDMVLNHTSSQHPWFKASRDPASPYRDWYIWSPTDPGYLGPWGEKVWHPAQGSYYYGIFETNMPDLNYTDPAVTAEMDKVFAFWLKEVGVDGFRLDAAKHLIEDGPVQQNTAATHSWYRGFRVFYKSENSGAMTVGEISGDDGKTLASYTSDDQLDLAFDFQLADALVQAAKTGRARAAMNTLLFSTRLIPGLRFAPFLANHDQPRLMTQLGGSVNKAKVAASMLLTSPGVPFIYYGEEIGMTGAKPDQNIRRPMQWTADAAAGFTTGKPWQPPDAGYADLNVAAQQDDPESLLAHYRALIHLRNDHPSLRVGELAVINAGNAALFAVLRTTPDETALVVINLGDAAISDYALRLDKSPLPAGTYNVIPLLGGGSFGTLTVSSAGGFQDYRPLQAIPPYATLILQLAP